MPKYDAFGREIGEDTLSGLGGSPPETDWRDQPIPEPVSPDAERVVREPEPEPARPEFVTDDARRRELAAQLSGTLQQAARARTDPGAPTVTIQRSGTAKGCLIAIVVVLLLGGAAIAGVVSLVGSIDTSGIEKTIGVPATPPRPMPKGLAEGSLVRRAAVASALSTLRSEEGVKLANLRVSPDRINATLLTRAGRLRHMQMLAGEQLERSGTDGSAGFDSVPTIPFAKLDPGAPQRLARRGAREHGVPISELQYAVPIYSRSDRRLTWAVYFTRGRYVLGDAKGRFQRKLP